MKKSGKQILSTTMGLGLQLLCGYASRFLTFVLNIGLVWAGICYLADRAQATNFLQNASFETAVETQQLWGIVGWTSSVQQGGAAVTVTNAHAGNRVFRLDAYGPGSRYLSQSFMVSPGLLYEVSGWLRTGPGEFSPTNGYAAIVLQFFGANGLKIGPNVESVRAGASLPNLWTQFTSGPALAPPGAVTAKVICAYIGAGDLTINGSVEFDAMCAWTTSVPRAGVLLNPGFEVQPWSPLTNVPYWMGYGNAGAVVTNLARSGRASLQIWWTETLLGQCWPATPSSRYAFSGYAMIPSSSLFVATNVRALLVLQYLDAASNVLASYESAALTPSSPTGVWHSLSVAGVAPSGTVWGRVFCAALGSDTWTNTKVSVYFDDLSVEQLDYETTTCGLLRNPGFEDGASGDAYILQQIDSLPGWYWPGSTNSGFVQQNIKRSGYQAAAITWTENLFMQTFIATAGVHYVLKGYAFNPVGADKLRGDAHACLLLEFLDVGPYWDAAQGRVVTGTVAASVRESAWITASSEPGWYELTITQRAPVRANVSVITGRVCAAILGQTTNVGGAIFFDDFCLTPTNLPPPVDTFDGGLLQNGSFEQTSPGTKLQFVDDWTGFGFDGMVVHGIAASGVNALRIYWTETLLAQSIRITNYYVRYLAEAKALTPSADKLRGNASLVQALLILQFLGVNSNVLLACPSQALRPTSPSDSWVHLTASAIAPSGTRYVRVMIGIVGPSQGFGGSVYFDDVSLRIVGEVPPPSNPCGLIYNSGFEDGAAGNLWDLQESGQLPNWKWAGGQQAGWIAYDYSRDGARAVVIAWPLNGVYQDFRAESNALYVASGYMFTPSTARFTSDGGSWGELVLSFYVDGSTNPAEPYIYHSERFEATRAPDTWHYFCVTGRAPPAGVVTGRLFCFFYSQDPFSDFGLGGTIWFDSLCVTYLSVTNSYDAWCLRHFGSPGGVGTGPSEDWDGDGTDNWTEFIAGTDPTQTGSLFRAPTCCRSEVDRLALSWPSVSQRWYALYVCTDLMNAAWQPLATNLPATPPMNTYTDLLPQSDHRFYRLSCSANPDGL